LDVTFEIRNLFGKCKAGQQINGISLDERKSNKDPEITIVKEINVDKTLFRR
jgi:hypothetical protein